MRGKRLIALLAAASVLAVSLPLGAQDAEMPFKDVPRGHWAYDAIKELSKRNILRGYVEREGRFYRGDNYITRYEFAVALLYAMQNMREEGILKPLEGRAGAGVTEGESIRSVVVALNDDVDDLKVRSSELSEKMFSMESRLRTLEDAGGKGREEERAIWEEVNARLANLEGKVVAAEEAGTSSGGASTVAIWLSAIALVISIPAIVLSIMALSK
ncbi:MAG: S-layer homology domain-containing protein [bacterium]